MAGWPEGLMLSTGETGLTRERDGLRIRPMEIVMGAEEDWPDVGCHSRWVCRTDRVPLSFLYDASTDGDGVVILFKSLLENVKFGTIGALSV